MPRTGGISPFLGLTRLIPGFPLYARPGAKILFVLIL
jgi:hypothetical protein